MAIFSSDIVTSAISASIADTAVDVFVYDTTKDSDGGAWRYRTQNTSWYNETLNTATRGSRKEFPSVAVIVAEATQVTIYDGDDPDLPMWMVFERGGNNHPFLDGTTPGSSFLGNYPPTSLSALNGIICVGSLRPAGALSNLNAGLRKFSFIEDACYATNNINTYKLGTIFVDRNARTTTQIAQGGSIANVNVNDLVTTVLPNAPIDDATGLPIPTIAVATDGGVSVIRDDGNVVNATGSGIYAYSKAITITEENYLWWLGDSYLTNDILRDSWAVSLDNFPSSDFTWNSSTDNMSAGSYYAVTTDGEAGEIKIGSGNTWAWNKQERNALGGPAGLAIHKPNIGSENNSLIAAITSDYNTGWMHGDIKGAFLSDTSTVSIPGSNFVTNGDFSNGSTGWTVQSGWTVSSNTATCDGTNGAYISQPAGDLPINTPITVTVTITAYTSGTIRLGSTGIAPAIQHSGTGTYSTTFRTRSGGASGVEIMSVNFVGTIDNVIVTLAEEDRSVDDNGLQVFGTITKSAVATGAELVGYSGFSASNYLQQPYNSDLAPGTEAYSVSCWFKTGTSSGDQYIFDRNGGGAGSRNLLLIMNTSAGNANRLQYWHRDNTGNITDIQIADKIVTDNVWHQVVALNDGSSYRVYVDGKVSSVTSSLIRNVINDNDPPMFIGVRHTGGSTFMTGSMALFRYSKSAPSSEQIKKMYEDEKCLFHENAKATLYGSSDAVTALAYDEVTDQLHVGTSAGRSDFQGLRRINNTTTAVTTAISAHDTFIIEQ